jgi:HPt (histidine-containing phosphotransfer) domain-containing protein
MEIHPSGRTGVSAVQDLSADRSMVIPEIVAQIQSLHTVLGEAKVGDLGSMAGVLRHVQDLEQAAASGGEPVLAGVCDAIGEIVKRLLMDEEPDAEKSLAMLRETSNILLGSSQKGALPEAEAFPAAIRPTIAPPPQPQSSQISYKDEDILADFLSRQAVVLQELEVHILALEKGRAPESLAALLHILHTMKGDSGFLGLSSVEQLCHSTENYLQSAQYPYDIESMLMVKDWLASTFAAISTGIDQMPSADTLITRLEGLGRERLEIPPDETKIELVQPAESVASTASQVLQADPSLLSDFI